MIDSLRTLRGIVRSLRIYYGDNGERRAAMDLLHRRFIKPGDLVFDIGAHVGDRVAAFRRLDARVVAVEPQPALVRMLRLLYGRNRAVTIEPLAVACRPGAIELRLNLANPTVSTASGALVQAAREAPQWAKQAWTRSVAVPAVTLDALIERHGTPAFIKIDVEGLEAEVLAGLSRAVATLSFEFTTILPEVTQECIARCAALGYARYNATLGERHVLIHAGWLSAAEIADWVLSLPLETNSGDIYAVQESGIRDQQSEGSARYLTADT